MFVHFRSITVWSSSICSGFKSTICSSAKGSNVVRQIKSVQCWFISVQFQCWCWKMWFSCKADLQKRVPSSSLIQFKFCAVRKCCHFNTFMKIKCLSDPKYAKQKARNPNSIRKNLWRNQALSWDQFSSGLTRTKYSFTVLAKMTPRISSSEIQLWIYNLWQHLMIQPLLLPPITTVVLYSRDTN